MEITVTDMRARQKPGYVARLVKGDRQFLSAKSCSHYGTSAKECIYDIQEDGFYEICDANFGSRQRHVKVIQFINGEIVKSAKSLEELLTADLDLPDLEGSFNQINWALQIRERFLAKFILEEKSIPEKYLTLTSAKWWIDNRFDLNKITI